MKKLIVHIEYDENEVEPLAIQETLDHSLEGMKFKYTVNGAPLPEERDISWRFFESLDEAMEWETPIPDVEVALRLVGHLRRMIGKMAEEGMRLPH